MVSLSWNRVRQHMLQRVDLESMWICWDYVVASQEGLGPSPNTYHVTRIAEIETSEFIFSLFLSRCFEKNK